MHSEILTTEKKNFFRKENFVFLLLILIFTFSSLYFTFKDFVPALAIGTFSHDFQTIDDAESISGTWVAFSGTGAVKNLALTSEVFVEGSNSIYWQQNSIGSAGWYKDLSPTVNVQNKQLWFYFYTGISTEGSVRNFYTNLGFQLYDGAGRTGNSSTWQVCSNLVQCQDTLVSGWKSFKFYTTQPDATSGALNQAAVASIALNFTSNSKITPRSGSVPVAFDYWRVGKTIGFTGGTAANPVTFQDVKTYSDANVLDAISITGNAVDLKVNLEVGSSTLGFPATVFTDTNKYIGMNMANSDDKLGFTLHTNSTTTLVHLKIILLLMVIQSHIQLLHLQQSKSILA